MYKNDWYALTIAVLILLIVLVACYLCVQLYKEYNPSAKDTMKDTMKDTGTAKKRSGFCAGSGCVGMFGGRALNRLNNMGPEGWAQYPIDPRFATTGLVPSIEYDSSQATVPWAPCCGSLGIQPPIYQ